MALEYNHSSVAYKAGRAEMERGNFQAAIQYFSKSVEHLPHFKTLELMGECYLTLGNPREAIVPLAAAIALGSNEFKASYLLSRAFLELGERNDALKYVTRALEMKPDFKRARELRDAIAGGARLTSD
jgi:tetratricopeptide (TPR) repeat protein